MAHRILRPGVRANYLVVRKLRLVHHEGAEQGGFGGALQALLGFNRCEFNGTTLRLEYDASQLHISTVLAALAPFNLRSKRGRFDRFRLSWYHYADSNAYANARDTGNSACSQSPLRFR